MRRLRILQIFNRYIYPGGEESSVFRIGDALSKDFDVEYFVGSTKDLLGRGISNKVVAPFLAFNNFPVASRLAKYQQIGRFDLWQIHNVFPGLSPSVYQTAFRLNVPIVHYLHNYRMSCANGFFLNHGQPCERCLHGNFWPAFRTACWRDSRLISGFMGLILKRARAVGTFQNVAAWIALSHSQRSKHIEMGIPQNRIHVVPHFHEPMGDPIPPCPNGNILFLGRLSPEKGVDLLLRSWKFVQPKERKLIIAGQGPEEPRLRKLAIELGLRNVEFVGFMNQEQQRNIWAKTAFSVIPSIWNEPFGLVFLEAWARGRTFVASRLGAMAESVSEGQDGLLAEPFSPHSLSSKIQQLIDHPDRTMEMGRAGQGRILNEFHRKLWLSRIKSVYQRILPD